MHPIVGKTQLSPNVTRLVVEAPRIAQIRQPGQFVIVRAAEGAERIPLTIADADPGGGHDHADHPGHRQDDRGPRRARSGRRDPRHRRPAGPGDRAARARPRRVRRWRRRHGRHPAASPRACTRSRRRCHEHHWRPLARMGHPRGGAAAPTARSSPAPTTARTAGQASSPRPWPRCSPDEPPTVVYAVGPVPMMRAVVELTRAAGVPTIVSLNPIMVDGTGHVRRLPRQRRRRDAVRLCRRTRVRRRTRSTSPS